MTRVYNEDAFSARVNLAACYIAAERATTRTFDTCFEMNDGKVVAVALFRRAQANPTGGLARNLFKYISEDLTRENAKEMEHVPTKSLGEAAAAMRAAARAAFESFIAERK